MQNRSHAVMAQRTEAKDNADIAKTELIPIPPCRKTLEKATDYDIP